jgi:hypothetical protein
MKHGSVPAKCGNPEADVKGLVDELIAKVGIEALIEALIARVGTKDEVIWLIKASKAKGTRGPSSGLRYYEIDRHLILHAAALRIEWIRRLGCRPQDKRLPAWKALLRKIVDLCWDRKVAERLGVSFGKLNHLGQDVDSVVKRLQGRPKLLMVATGDCAKREVERIIKLKREAKSAVARPEQKLLWFSFTDARRENTPKSPERKPDFLLFETVEAPEAKGQDSLWLYPRLLFFPPLPESWDAMHRLRPDLGLLPTPII